MEIIMNKEIDVNNFCATSGIATSRDAENLYNHIKDSASDDTVVVLDFSNTTLVDLSFFKTLLLHYYPDTDHLKFSNLSDEQKTLVKKTFLCLIEGTL